MVDTPQDQANATDQVNMTIQKGASAAGAAATNAGGPSNATSVVHKIGTPVAEVTTPERAMSVLKEKVGLIHTVVNNASHLGTVAWNDLESLMADVKYLITFGRSAAKK